MKHLWINRRGNNELVVFFNGWGMDEKPFSHLKTDDLDVLMFYDYRDLKLPELKLEYTRINLVAWSFGVWAYAASGLELPFSRIIAFGGTLRPICAEEGIDPAVFMSTVENWNEGGRSKFYRRICGGTAGFEQFSQPERAVEEQLEELKTIGLAAMTGAEARFTRAMVGENDRIFAVNAQLNSWSKRGVKTVLVPEAHYMFGKYHYWKELLFNED
jgi:biotin synthesis protein BioG